MTGILNDQQLGYARAVLQAGQDLGITERGIVIGFAAVFVESDWVMYANQNDPASLNYPHDALSFDTNSDGLFQQRDPWWGTVADRMDPYRSAKLFFTALARLDYNNPANSPGSYAQAVQQSAFPDRYDQRIPDAQALYDQLTQGTPPVADRPDFNEYPLWSSNNQDRAGTPIDLFLLHTEEGNMNADALARWMDTTSGASAVSYHYTVSEDQNDHGVTVCDVVDTDLASWSVLSSNDRSINLCFAGSFTAWTRDDWLSKFPKAIDVAAYLAVQDCLKYGIAINVIPPPYNSDPPGISDHRYCTEHLKDGNTHTDVGDGFPWDVFTAAVNKYAGVTPPAPAPAPTPPAALPDYQVLTYEQLAGPRQPDGYGHGWDQLRGKTVVDALSGMQTDLSSMKNELDNLTAMVSALMTQPKPTTRFRWFHRKAK